jgi:catechol 2,3-dioxygenase-like lactoylglutathione lyase family enzyme
MNILFVSSVSPIAVDPPESRKLYVDVLGLPLDGDDPEGYWHSEKVEGTNHFGVWPLKQAAEACFGSEAWPDGVTVPQVSIEFEVADADAVASGAKELEEQGYELLHGAKTEPWGQTVARLLSADGAIVGLSFAPWMH